MRPLCLRSDERLHSRNGMRSQGWASAVERLRPVRKRSECGAFGGWNDLDRMVKWREGGGGTNALTGDSVICDAGGGRRTQSNSTEQSGVRRGKKQHEATSRIPKDHLEKISAVS